MQVTLKKAAELARLALAAAESVVLRPTAEVSIYTERTVAEVAVEMRAANQKEVQEKLDLLAAGWRIRDLIGERNANVGINALLTQRSYITAQENAITAVVAQIPSAMGTEPLETTQRRLDSLKTVERTGSDSTMLRGQATAVRLPITDDEYREALRTTLARLRQDKSDTSDKIAGLNLNTKIELDDKIVRALKGAKIIA